MNGIYLCFVNKFFLIGRYRDFKPFQNNKMKEFADNNSKSDDNGRKFSRWVENTMGKGEIAHYKQFLLFP